MLQPPPLAPCCRLVPIVDLDRSESTVFRHPGELDLNLREYMVCAGVVVVKVAVANVVVLVRPPLPPKATAMTAGAYAARRGLPSACVVSRVHQHPTRSVPPRARWPQVVLDKPVGLTLAPDPRTGQVGFLQR